MPTKVLDHNILHQEDKGGQTLKSVPVCDFNP